jgi:hypothetical protein
VAKESAYTNEENRYRHKKPTLGTIGESVEQWNELGERNEQEHKTDGSYQIAHQYRPSETLATSRFCIAWRGHGEILILM